MTIIAVSYPSSEHCWTLKCFFSGLCLYVFLQLIKLGKLMACQRVSGDDKAAAAAAAALKRPNLVKYHLGTFSHLFVGSRLSPILILIFTSWDDFVFVFCFIVLFALILPPLLLLLHSVVVVATVAVTSANVCVCWLENQQQQQQIWGNHHHHPFSLCFVAAGCQVVPRAI